MNYLAPRAFATLRPHLAMMLSDDPAAEIARIQAASSAASKPFSEILIGTAMGGRPADIQRFAMAKGFENVAWETAAIEALRVFHLGAGDYHVCPAPETSAFPPASVLRGLEKPVYVEIEGRRGRFAGASFSRVPAALAQGDERRDHVQITVWPRQTDADWKRPLPIGHFLTVAEADGDDLETAIEIGVAKARRHAADVPLEGFASESTTTWNDVLAETVRDHAAAVAAFVGSPMPTPRWQDGIKPYLLAKLEGPKGGAAEAALLRRGYVRIHHHV